MSRTLLAATALILTPLVTGCDGDGATPKSVVETTEPAWSDGRTIWWGDRTIETGSDGPIRSFAHTTDAVVWVDADGAVWSSDGEAQPTQIGEAGGAGQVKADRWGSTVAWVEALTGEPASLNVYDTGTEQERLRTGEGLSSDMRTERNVYTELSRWPPADTRAVAWIHAVDGDDVWWLGTRGTSVTDTRTGGTEVVQSLAEGADEFTVLDVVGDTLLSYPFDAEQPDPAGPVLSGDRPDEGVSLESSQPNGALSPDGARALVVVGEDHQVRRAQDGRLEATIDEVEPAGWLGASSFVAVDTRSEGRRVVVCEVGGDCTPYADITSKGPLLWPGG